MADDFVSRTEFEKHCELRHDPIADFMARTERHFGELFSRFNHLYILIIVALLGIIGSLASQIIIKRDMPEITIKIDKEVVERVVD